MLQRTKALREVRARDAQLTAEDVLRDQFREVLPARTTLDAQFVAPQRAAIVIGVAGMPFRAPLIATLLADSTVFGELEKLWRGGQSVLLIVSPQEIKTFVGESNMKPVPVALPGPMAGIVATLVGQAVTWPGSLNEKGHHIFDSRSPAPGPHFFTNLLLGNRVGFLKPLQTTPKSVVDQFGRGSFRSHAGTQVLATRWDLRAEENGFPANRQCYLVENGCQIFYSGDPVDSNLLEARTAHAQNHTVIRHRTRCGLEITRTIFLLPAEEGLPLATEVQSIAIANLGNTKRQLRLIVTGMFGPPAPNALWEDVVYTNVSMEGRIFQGGDGEILGVSPHYHPLWTKGDERFHTMIVHHRGRTLFPNEVCTSYNEFVGRGTLERPEGLRLLSNRLARKGPGFFALGVSMPLDPAENVRVDNFTALVSDKGDPTFSEHSLPDQLDRLITRFSSAAAVPEALGKQLRFLDRFRQHLQVRTDDADFDSFVNENLPFQILYQTFVSRSFDQTQKGHREIGFREVQDLFASLPFIVAMGEKEFAKDLLLQWAAQIYEFGYANHNFYWQGKEPGDFSDDALWFIQAVDCYLNLTGDWHFLNHECEIAGAAGKRRSVYEAIKAVLRYSGEISVGKHGMPLLDRADWNDTLRLDPHYLNGPEKEEAYRKQKAAGVQREALETDNSESVMNAFLLEIALAATLRFAAQRGDMDYATKLRQQSQALREGLQQQTWKRDFFARVLINRPGRFSYLGARGDGLSADPKVDGTYFLNSFSWPILANIATEQQIQTMLKVLKDVLWTPYGLKLCSAVNFAAITDRGGTAEYFSGDRENAGVFKHANMMAAVAMLRAAKSVSDAKLASELHEFAYRVIDVVLPYRTLRNPYVLAGNPRFCTQYNNSETGENIGPTLSGTAPWLWLALREGYGIEAKPEGIALDPLLPNAQTAVELNLDTGKGRYRIEIVKPKGFCRRRDRAPRLTIDGKPVADGLIPYFEDGVWHEVEVRYE